MGSPTLKTWKRMVRDGQSNEVSDERLMRLIESGLWDAVVDAPDYRALLADIRRPRSDGEFTVLIKNGETFDSLVSAGKYDWKWDEITAKRFPVRQSEPGERKLAVRHFGRTVSSEEAIEQAAKQGLERPTYEDCFRFGAQHPEVQRQFPVVFLHEPVPVRGSLSVLYLRCLDSKRVLTSYWFDDDWHGSYRFVFVRK